MDGSLVDVRGKRLYVETHGDPSHPPLLYLHGGPGEGCYEFMQHQARRLADKLYLIGFDQRGVWRSEAVEEDELLTLQDLVEDCEVLRVELGISGWAVLGHSFGAFLGVLYASRYPKSVECLILEGASLDLPKSLKSWLRKAAMVYESIGKAQEAHQCVVVSRADRPPHGILEAFFELGQGLGELRMKVYTPNEGNNYSEMKFTAEQLEEYGRRSSLHLGKLIAEGRIFDSGLPTLKQLEQPVLMIKGRHDPIICEEQTTAFLQDVRLGVLKVYETCGHLPHFEAPDRFARDVIEFILER